MPNGDDLSPCTLHSLWGPFHGLPSEGVSTQCARPYLMATRGLCRDNRTRQGKSLEVILRLSHLWHPRAGLGMSTRHLPRGIWQSLAGPRWTSLRELQAPAPGSATTPMCHAGLVSKTPSACRPGRPGGPAQGPACAPCLAFTPTAWGPSPPLSFSLSCMPASLRPPPGTPAKPPGPWPHTLPSHCPLQAQLASPPR